MVKQVIRTLGVGLCRLILLSVGITVRRRLFRGFIVQSKRFSRLLNSGFHANLAVHAPFPLLPWPSHSELFDSPLRLAISERCAGFGTCAFPFARFFIFHPGRLPLTVSLFM